MHNNKNVPAEMHHTQPKMRSSMMLTESSRNKCEHHKNVPNTVINYAADLKCATAAEFCCKVTISGLSLISGNELELMENTLASLTLA